MKSAGNTPFLKILIIVFEYQQVLSTGFTTLGVSYRKAGYSKKFYEEHREAIMLHKAAKNAFAELNVTKIPKVKELSAEYAGILAEKKKLYGEYRSVKKDMMDYQIAKQNIDQFLKIDAEQQEQNRNKKKYKDTDR